MKNAKLKQPSLFGNTLEVKPDETLTGNIETLYNLIYVTKHFIRLQDVSNLTCIPMSDLRSILTKYSYYFECEVIRFGLHVCISPSALRFIINHCKNSSDGLRLENIVTEVDFNIGEMYRDLINTQTFESLGKQMLTLEDSLTDDEELTYSRLKEYIISNNLTIDINTHGFWIIVMEHIKNPDNLKPFVGLKHLTYLLTTSIEKPNIVIETLNVKDL